jgi:hypothetical protein
MNPTMMVPMAVVASEFLTEADVAATRYEEGGGDGEEDKIVHDKRPGFRSHHPRNRGAPKLRNRP